ncbi:putative HTH-type transcriptional regulator YjiR [Marinomonas aquimarina]|uniref:Putative HTH-type transcriptional regulator YjiR n=1 Tax=Marinomonas aquimarina TaxID=295068 RepID=A0A1A8TLE7_9GAMM|nr:PLP-dependent aminotransferase family protein [Marinomonas aquimarina]SBS33282.1 putative HTH-type transcriptional regulator YjiR [Marinomonas aquimarina]
MSAFRYQALEVLLRQQIQAGRYQVGEKLPSVRTLCQQHTLSKATVVHALHKLEADQLVYAVPKSGYFVAEGMSYTDLPRKVSTPSVPAPVNVPDIFRDIMSRSAAFDILPSDGSTPVSQHLITLNRMIAKSSRTHPEQKAYYYDEPKGYAGLRQAIVDLYRQRNTPMNAEDLCITSGCQHALFLALMASCQAGDTVAIESPAFYGVLQQLEQLGLNVIEIPSDSNTGLDIAELEAKIQHWPIKACIVTPNFHTPTGSKMPVANMKALLMLANQHDFYIIEDDIYGELGFQNGPCPAIKSECTQGRVILCGSFSKCLSRELRMGWIAGGRLHAKIVQLKLITQLASPQAIQQGLAAFIHQGHFKRHANQYRQQLKEQSDQLLTELKRGWGQAIKFSRPQGGLSCWVELPEHIDTQKSYPSLLEKGVVLTPGALFSAHGLYRNHMRLSFSQPLTEGRRSALQLLFHTLLKDEP